MRCGERVQRAVSTQREHLVVVVQPHNRRNVRELAAVVPRPRLHVAPGREAVAQRRRDEDRNTNGVEHSLVKVINKHCSLAGQRRTTGHQARSNEAAGEVGGRHGRRQRESVPRKEERRHNSLLWAWPHRS